MHIVHAVRQFHPGIGGLEDFVLQLAREQVRAGHRVTVATLDYVVDSKDPGPLPHEEQLDGITIRRYRSFGSHRYPIAPGILGAVRGADIVHVHALDFIHDYLALTWPLHRKKMVFSTHGLFFHTEFASKGKEVFFATVTRLTTLGYGQVLGSSFQDSERFGRIRKTGVMTIENGVNFAKLAGAEGSDEPVLIYFGRLAPNKQVDRLIRWFAALHGKAPEWKLIVAGKPTGVTIAELERTARDCGLAADAVEFHEMPSDEELRALIGRASAYACASSYEGFGLAAIEAAAAGLFLALSPIVPFARTLQNLPEGAGMTVDFADPGSADAFLAGWQHRRRGDAGSRLADLQSRFGWERVGADFERAYAAVIGNEERVVGPVRTQVANREQALAMAGDLIARHQGGTIGFCNHHTAIQARRNPDVAKVLSNALVFSDGIAMDFASWLLYGKSFPENLNGTDFIPDLLATLGPTRIAMIGSKDGVAERAAAKFAERYPQHSFVEIHHGFLSDEESRALVAQIDAQDVELVLVGMGNPAQERWIGNYAGNSKAVYAGIGALFDFTSGEIARAPKTVRKLRMEWGYRLLREPKRMSDRYIVGGIVFLGMVLKQKIMGQKV